AGGAAEVGDVADAGCRPWRTVWRRSLVIAVIAILDPFPEVAVHVVEAERVGEERADWRRLPAIPLTAAAVAVGVPVPDLVAPGIGRAGTGARGVFPFGLGEQPVGPAGHSGKPCHILLGIVPIDAAQWLPTASPTVPDARITIAMGGARIPLRECHFEPRDGERLGKRDLVQRTFIVETVLLIRGRAHHEFARRNDDHLGTIRAFLERIAWLENALLDRREHLAAHNGEPIDVLLQPLLALPGGHRRNNPDDDHADSRPLRLHHSGHRRCRRPWHRHVLRPELDHALCTENTIRVDLVTASAAVSRPQ